MAPHPFQRSEYANYSLTDWQCDLSTPSCGQCVRGRRACFGYRNPRDLLFHNQSEEVARKARRSKRTSQRRVTEPATKVPAAKVDSFQVMSQPEFSKYSDTTSRTSLSRSTSAENQAFCFFFSNYPSQPSKNFGSVYEDIPTLHSLEKSDGPLLCIITALGLAGFSHHTETSSVEVAARAWYDKALHKINSNLRDRELVKLDQTILVVLLLGFYETNTCSTPRSMRNWLKHIKGATALLDLRGEEQLGSELGRNLFVQTRTYIIAGCYQTRSPIPDIIFQLSQKCRHRSADPLEDLILIVLQFCNIRAEMPFHPIMSQSESTTRAAIARCTSIAEALADWHRDLPAAFFPSTVSAGTASSGILSEDYDVYEDLWAAGIVNNYRANSILVHEALINQLDFLRAHYSHDLKEVLNLGDQILHFRNTILSLIDAICASVPSLLQSNFAAGVGLLWPLYVSAQISPRAAPVHEATRSWIIERLAKIGTDMNVQATTFAGLLYENIEVTELLKDEYAREPGDPMEALATIPPGFVHVFPVHT